MIGSILPVLKFLSASLAISLICRLRYILLRRQLRKTYAEHKDEILEAIKGNELKFSSFLVEPTETGNNMLDLLLFKIHRSAMWFMVLLFFYGFSVISLYVALRLLQK
jgi:hypothetical protein